MPAHGCSFPGSSAAGGVQAADLLRREAQDARILQGRETAPFCPKLHGFPQVMLREDLHSPIKIQVQFFPSVFKAMSQLTKTKLYLWAPAVLGSS